MPEMQLAGDEPDTVPVADSLPAEILDPRRGDQKDWRKFRFVDDTKVTVLVVMAPLQVNSIRGKIEVYDDTFALIRKTMKLSMGYGLLLIIFIIIEIKK